jgi:hypothetical protein
VSESELASCHFRFSQRCFVSRSRPAPPAASLKLIRRRYGLDIRWRLE